MDDDVVVKAETVFEEVDDAIKTTTTASSSTCTSRKDVIIVIICVCLSFFFRLRFFVSFRSSCLVTCKQNSSDYNTTNKSVE